MKRYTVQFKSTYQRKSDFEVWDRETMQSRRLRVNLDSGQFEPVCDNMPNSAEELAIREYMTVRGIT